MAPYSRYPDTSPRTICPADGTWLLGKAITPFSVASPSEGHLGLPWLRKQSISSRRYLRANPCSRTAVHLRLSIRPRTARHVTAMAM